MIAPGCALHDRHLHLERRHEVGRAGLRHAGIHARDADDRADGALLRAAAARRRASARPTCRTGRRCGKRCNSLWAAVQSGTNLVYHAAGWLEGGLIACPEKFVMDCEVLQMIQRYIEPATWATDARRHRHRRDRGSRPRWSLSSASSTRRTATPTAFYRPIASATGGTSRPGSWMAGSGPPERAHRIYKEILAEFEPPPMDAAIRDELRRLRRAPQDRRRRADGFLTPRRSFLTPRA